MKNQNLPSDECGVTGCGMQRLSSIPKALCALLALSSILMVTHVPAQGAEEIPFFLEDFEDGDAGDGNPVTWVMWERSAAGSTGAVSDGSYVLTTAGDSSSVVAQEFASIGDVSIRVLARGLEVGSGSYIVLFADVQADGRSHWALVTQEGLHTGSGLSGRSGIIGTVFQPGAFDPFTGDVNIQFDVVGTKLSLTVWRLGSPKPSQPQLTSNAPRLAPGSVGFGTDCRQIAIRSFDAIQIPPPPPPRPRRLSWERVGGNVLRFTVPTEYDLQSSPSMDSPQWSVAGVPNRQGQLDVTVSDSAQFFQLRSK